MLNKESGEESKKQFDYAPMICPECQDKFKDDIKEWDFIREVLEFRAKTNLLSDKQGKIHHYLGKEDDYLMTIARGADENLYGRYLDIENIGSDVDF